MERETNDINKHRKSRYDNEQDSTFSMMINSELKKKFNIKCIEQNTTMAKVLKDFIESYI